MAYNSRAAKESQEALRAMDAQRAYAEEGGARGAAPASAPAPAPSPASSAGGFRRYGSSAPRAETSAPASVPAPAPAPAPSAGSTLADRPRFGQRSETGAAPSGASFHRAPLHVPPPEEKAGSETGPRGYASRLTAPHAPSRPGLTWRLEKLIDEVSAYRGFSPARIEQIKDEAAKRPEEAMRAYQEVYHREVVPFRNTAVHSIQEAVQKHPGKIVFAVQRGQQIEYDVQEPGTLNDLFHGAVLESVSMRKTPFIKPSELFAKVAQERQHRPTNDSVSSPPSVSSDLAEVNPDLDMDDEGVPFDQGDVNAQVGPESNPFKSAAPAPSGTGFSRFQRPRT